MLCVCVCVCVRVRVLYVRVQDVSIRLFVLTNLKSGDAASDSLGWRLNLKAIAKFMSEVVAFSFTGPVSVRPCRSRSYRIALAVVNNNVLLRVVLCPVNCVSLSRTIVPAGCAVVFALLPLLSECLSQCV